MNTEITLATELELSDVELETVVGGTSFSIGSISIFSPRRYYYYGSDNTVNQTYAPTGDTINKGGLYTHDSSNGIVSNAGYNSYNGGTYTIGN